MNNYIQKGTPQYWRAISALFLGTLASFGIMYCTQPLIPIFSKEFGLNPSVASLAMSVTSGGLAISMLVIAGLAGFLDRKLTMAVSLLGSAILAVASAFSNDFTTILICRAFQGVLVAGFPALAMAYINEEFEPGITGFVIGIYISGTSIGGLSSRLLVSTLTDFFSWKIALVCIGILYLTISIWFCFGIPKSKHFLPQKHLPQHMVSDLLKNLRSPVTLRLYLIAFAIMGSFSAVYNYIGYSLMAPPYNLSQTAVGGLFLLYLLGTFSSTFMGGMADRFGSASILCLSMAIMLVGGIVTLMASLTFKIIGLAIFTFGFFGSHSTATSWVGKSCLGDKAQAASLYLLFYYFGASVIGTVGGLFLSSYGWPGVILLSGFISGAALLLSIRLLTTETHRAMPGVEL
ncbi:MAG: major facilitator superfamily 1 [Anaerosporomusa subterranea]|jgi:YNFM family putative membrane transporter|nr:major facilitator superfamily 1 [Anaerosporomusa subterranea]